MDELINIADQINNKYNNIENNLKSALQNAIECGELLVQAKNNCKHGEFINWIKSNCQNIHIDTAYQYIKIYQHNDKIRNVRNLQTAYKKIAEIEYKEKKQLEEKRQQRCKQYKKTGQKPADWSRADDYSYKKYFDEEARTKRIAEAVEKEKEKSDLNKQKRINNLNSNNEVMSRAALFLKNLLKQNDEQQKFLTKITDGNQYQSIFFKIIDNYVNELSCDIEKMEALQNIIKYCKRVMIKYHQTHISEKKE